MIDNEEAPTVSDDRFARTHLSRKISLVSCMMVWITGLGIAYWLTRGSRVAISLTATVSALVIACLLLAYMYYALRCRRIRTYMRQADPEAGPREVTAIAGVLDLHPGGLAISSSLRTAELLVMATPLMPHLDAWLGTRLTAWPPLGVVSYAVMLAGAFAVSFGISAAAAGRMASLDQLLRAASDSDLLL